MNIQLVIGALGALGTVVAGVALALTYVQVRRLDRSIKGNTYQLLSDQALSLLALSIEYPDLRYMQFGPSENDRAEHRQAVYERMWANYIDNVWGQMNLGLISAELRATYLALIEQFLRLIPERNRLGPNFSASLRR
jgi:hypothetical protein